MVSLVASKPPRPVLLSVLFVRRASRLCSLASSDVTRSHCPPPTAEFAGGLIETHCATRGPQTEKGRGTFCAPHSVCSLVANESVAPQSTHLNQFYSEISPVSTFTMPVIFCPNVAFNLISAPLTSLSPVSAREGPFAPAPRGGEAEAQAEAAGAAPQLVLHGRQVPGMLQDHHRLQPRPDGRPLRRMLHRALPAHRRTGETHRRCVVITRLFLTHFRFLKAPRDPLFGPRGSSMRSRASV